MIQCGNPVTERELVELTNTYLLSRDRTRDDLRAGALRALSCAHSCSAAGNGPNLDALLAYFRRELLGE